MSNAAIVYPPAIVEPGTTWLQLGKLWLMQHLGLDKDALHVYFALTLLFGSILLFRWTIRSWQPQALVLAFAIAGEAWDIRDGLMTRVPLVVSLPASIHDVWNTIFWPVAILLLARFTDVFGTRPAVLTSLEGDPTAPGFSQEMDSEA